MRIIGGEHKGRRIKVPRKGVRPTKGITRAAIFNVISDRVLNAEVLDIFAGSGALGLEAISRGAKSCIFIERNPKLLFENTGSFSGHHKNLRVITGDFRGGLRRLHSQQFDLIFIDPPYEKDYLTQALTLIVRYHLLRKIGIIVAEHSAQKEVCLSDHFLEFKKKHYGKTVISFLAPDPSKNQLPPVTIKQRDSS